MLQALLVLSLVGGLILSPAAKGQVMLVPLGEQAMRELPGLATRDDMKLVARGTINGSLIVSGRKAGFFDLLFHHSILALGVPAGGCTAG